MSELIFNLFWTQNTYLINSNSTLIKILRTYIYSMFSFSGISELTDSLSILDFFSPSYFSIFVVFFYFRQEMLKLRLPYIIAVDCSVSCFMCICTFVISFFHSLCVCVYCAYVGDMCHSTHLVFFSALYISQSLFSRWFSLTLTEICEANINFFSLNIILSTSC